jgi:MFS family permease
MAATSFALVSAEFLPAGMLTPMARDLGISEGTAGQVVTATASVGAVTAMLSNVLIGRLNRKTVLVGLSALAIGSNILAALATDFWLLLLGRAGWASPSAVSGRFQSPSWRGWLAANATGRGMAIVTLGVSLATIAAPSMGALISDWLGWRSRHGHDSRAGRACHAAAGAQPADTACNRKQQPCRRPSADTAAWHSTRNACHPFADDGAFCRLGLCASFPGTRDAP